MSATAEQTQVRTLDNYVGGSWAPPTDREALDDVDPFTGEVAARVPLSEAPEVDAAVRAARAAQPAWREVPPHRRARAVMALREVLWSNREELAQLVTADMGKTIDDARGEVLRGIESTEAATAIPHLLKGENLEGVARGVDVELVRQPVGVVAAITPFNFPCMIPLWFLPFALATGNAIVLKPSERDPRPSVRIFELIDAIEQIPPGVANLVHGGRDAVNGLLDHPEVDAISFVGQASTAMHVSKRAAATGKRFQALGGAKNSMVVMPDADLAQAIPAMLGSAFGNAGQRCLAGSVAVVVGEGERQDAVRDALVSEAAKLTLGPGVDPETDVSPLVSPEAREKIVDAVTRAEDEGAEVLLDGRGAGPGAAGTVLGPTIVEPDPAESELAREEVFGPLLTLVRAPDLDAALEFVNGSRYGNASAIFTSSGDAARAYRYGVEAGMVGVNVGVPAPVAWFPFAGWKDSMEGDLHANGLDAVEFYTRKKVLTSRWR
jgi:malonate-semialdehyde dehydrogenase (acetylating) / methylmalonate-semialdehyde dehydrogenase